VIVFQRLGIDVQWQFLPWKRCLSMLETGQADGALDIFHSDERDATAALPQRTAVGRGVRDVLRQRPPHPARTLEDLAA
jgi:polar amino acid transport system substrate-binding protein